MNAPPSVGSLGSGEEGCRLMTSADARNPKIVFSALLSLMRLMIVLSELGAC